MRYLLVVTSLWARQAVSFVASVTLVLLAGCSMSTPVTRYALPTPSYEVAPPQAGQTLIVAAVTLPYYALETRIATAGEGNTVHLDAAHRWAGFPQDMITEALIQALRSESVDAWSVGAAAESVAAAKALVTLDTFLRSVEGNAILRGNVVLSGVSASRVTRRFEIEVPLEDFAAAAGYNAYAQAIAEGIRQVAQHIKEALPSLQAVQAVSD